MRTTPATRFRAHRLTVAALLCAALTARAAAPAYAAAPADTPLDTRVLRTPTGLTEVGLLNGAPYRIDLPAGWNHKLVVFYHGYAETPVTFHLAEHVIATEQPYLDRHYALLQSGYSRTGWALQQAYPETEALRRYFIHRYGQPGETYAAGVSLGGVLVSITLELNPRPYLGGLDLCGSVGPSLDLLDRRFAYRAAFDHYFPDALPPLLKTPANFDDSAELHQRLLAALRADPAAANALRGIMGLHADIDVARDIGYFTHVIGDLQQRAAGNPFDNRNYIYTGAEMAQAPGLGSNADFELNDHVRRYAADPHARTYLIRHYTPSGRLGRPMLALHTVYDRIVPASGLAQYAHMVEAAGAAQNLVQQYVDREGHCNITPTQIGLAFDELQSWSHGGPRPRAGVLPEPTGPHESEPPFEPAASREAPLPHRSSGNLSRPTAQ